MPVTPARFVRVGATWRTAEAAPDLTTSGRETASRPVASPRRLPAGWAKLELLVQPPPVVSPRVGLMARGGQPRRRGSVWLPRLIGPPPVVPPTGSGGGSVLRPIFVRLPADVRFRQWPEFHPVAVSPSFPNPFLNRFGSVVPVARPRDQQARMRSGGLLCWVPIGLYVQGQVAYHIYSNAGVGDPINYTVPIGETSGLTWTSGGLTAPGDWKFAVRAYWTGSGLEEENLDCAVEILLDSHGNDITGRPAPPTGLRAFPTPGGGITVEWHYSQTTRTPPNAVIAGRGVPTGFHVYIGTGGSPSYTTPATTVLYGSGFLNAFQAVLSGLLDDTAYTLGVRAFNGTAEETNTVTVNVTAHATGPSPVVSLSARAIV
jgi:hypothetical protein